MATKAPREANQVQSVIAFLSFLQAATDNKLDQSCKMSLASPCISQEGECGNVSSSIHVSRTYLISPTSITRSRSHRTRFSIRLLFAKCLHILILHGSSFQDYSVVNSRPVAVSVGCEPTTFSHVSGSCSGYPSVPLQFVIFDQ